MDIDELLEIVKEIVEKADDLKVRYTAEREAKVNYACIFSQNDDEYEIFRKILEENGNAVLEETSTGPLFRIKDLDTIAGTLKLLKIRKYDDKHPDLGDADFTVSNYSKFKEECLKKPENFKLILKKPENFKLISGDGYEMIELTETGSDVRAYFSNPPIDEEMGIK